MAKIAGGLRNAEASLGSRSNQLALNAETRRLMTYQMWLTLNPSQRYSRVMSKIPQEERSGKSIREQQKLFEKYMKDNIADFRDVQSFWLVYKSPEGTKAPMAVKNLIWEKMIKGKVERRTINVKNEEGVTKFKKDAKFFIDNGLITFKQNPTNEKQYFIRLGWLGREASGKF